MLDAIRHWLGLWLVKRVIDVLPMPEKGEFCAQNLGLMERWAERWNARGAA